MHNAYFFSGAEDYLIEDSLKRVTAAVIKDPSTKEFNYALFFADQVNAGTIIETANAFPMLAECRMVVVKDLHKLAPSSLEALAKYLEKPSATTRLVLISDKFNARNKAFSQIKSRTCFVEFKPLYDNHVPGWIRDYLKAKGLEITYDASLLIHAYVGNNLRAIVTELDKIILNLDGEKKIQEADVQRVVGLSRKFSVFNLNDAIGHRDVRNSLLILNKMLDSGESHTAILAMISRHFVNLLKVKGCVEQGKSQSEIASMTGIPPFFVSKSKEMAQKYSFEQFENIFEYLLTTDLKLKTSQQSPKIALQTMLLRILH